MQVSPCDLCNGQTQVLFVFDERDNWVERCTQCHAECIKPFPTPYEIQRTYTNYHVTKTPEEDLGALIVYSTKALEFLLGKMSFSQTDPKDLTFLDMGFGNGAALLAASLKGIRAYGIDLDPVNVANVQSVSRKMGVSPACIRGDADTLRSMQVQFDIVKASQILEHLVNPTEFLSEVARSQPCGGCLIIDCPNNDAAFWLIKNRIRRAFGRMAFYNSLKLHEHLRGFTRRSLTFLLQKVGYRIILCRDYPMGSYIFQPETTLWYPPLNVAIRRSIKNRRIYDFLKGSIRMFDTMASLGFGRGMGLFALAKRVDGSYP